MYSADMYRKGRLSVHRKNEFRKRMAEKRASCTVTITHHLPVCIPKTADISIFKISISKEYYLNVTLKSLDSLKRKMEAVMKALSVVPAGLFTSYRFIANFQVGLTLPHSLPAMLLLGSRPKDQRCIV